MIRLYAKRLERDLPRWREKGWLTEEGYAAILAEQGGSQKLTASAALAAVGAVLFGFAAISFVAANWDEIPRLVRLFVLNAGLWSAYATAAILYKRGHDAFAQAAVLTGAAFFGACVVLVTQMYHIVSGNLPGFMFLWMAGAAAAGILFRSPLTLAGAMGLAVAWNYTQTEAVPHEVHWLFLPAWVALTAAIAWNRSGLGLHAAAIAFLWWLIPIQEILHPHIHTTMAAIGAAGVLAASAAVAVAQNEIARKIAIRAVPYAIVVCFAGLIPQYAGISTASAETALGIAAAVGIAYFLLYRQSPALQPVAPLLFSYALGVVFYGLWVLQFARHLDLTGTITVAAFAMAALAAGLMVGIHARSRLIMWLAYAGLVAEILALYAEKLGNLINTSLFFLVAGAFVFALAWVLMRYGKAPSEKEARS